MALIAPLIEKTEGRFVVTIAGESGSGKSETAAVLAEVLAEKDTKSVILQQDDYFVHPPKTNAEVRRRDVGWVGTGEVRLDLMDQNLADIIAGASTIEKPLVIFEEDRIDSERLDLEGIKVAIVEGTYTTSLKNVHQHVFNARNYIDTKQARQKRAREAQDEFLEEILRIEHKIISAQRAQADIIVTIDYEVMKNDISR